MSLVTGLFFLVLLLNQRWSPPLRLQVSHCSTFRILRDVPNIAVFCSESIECFPGTASKFFLKLLVTVPVALIITGIIVHFRFQNCSISINNLLYFNFFSASLLLLLLLLLLLKLHDMAAVLISPTRLRPPHYRGLTISLRHATIGRAPLNMKSVRSRGLYVTSHNTHKRQTSMPPAEFEPAIPASKRLQTHILNRAATGIGNVRACW